MTLGNRMVAARLLRECALSKPHEPEPYKALADLSMQATLLESKKPERLIEGAIDFYSKAIHRRPSYVAAYVGLGDARAAQGDLKGALHEYGRALALDPSFPDAHLGAGRVSARLGLCSEAAEAFGRAVRFDLEFKAVAPEMCIPAVPIGPP
jgi:tetratricopeptide (TPR) repeat protein